MKCWVLLVIVVACKEFEVFSLCQNEYADGIKTIAVGRPAIYKPPKRRYSTTDIVRFRCPKGFHFEESYWRRKEFVWIECGSLGWRDSWPTCRGPKENLTCINEYNSIHSNQNHWLRPDANQFHAMYTPKLDKYLTLKSVKFTCPQGMNFKGSRGLTLAQSMCTEDGWTKSWPMCKGHTCEPLEIKDAIITDGGMKLSPGVVVNITCHPGYYLWGINHSTCSSSLRWTGYPQECVTLEKFKQYCVLSHRTFKREGGKVECLGKKYTAFSANKDDRTKRITLSIAIPLSALFVILLTVSSLYVRRLRLRHQQMATAIQYQNADQAVNLVLPSYEDSLKSKPTTPPPTFEETFSFCEPAAGTSPTVDSFPSSQAPRYVSPPPYS